MHPVTAAYKTAVKSADQVWSVKLIIDTATRTFELTDEDIMEGGLTVNEGVMSSDVLAIGDAYKGDMSVILRNDTGMFDNVKLNGATLRPQVALEIAPGQFEWVPLGVFVVDEVSKPADTVSLKGFDNMNRFERPFSDVTVSFPCSALVLLSAVCQRCGVTLATTDFLHKNYTVTSRPEADMSCRDVVAYVAELAGTNARCNRQGQLELVWFRDPESVQEAILDGDTDTADGGDFSWWDSKIFDGGLFINPIPDVALDPYTRYDFEPEDNPITISGITFETETEVLLAGTERYVIDIKGNPLIQHDIPDVLHALLDKLQGFTYLPFSSNWIGDPAVQAGDMVLHTDLNGNVFRTVVAQSGFVYRGQSRILAGGKSGTASGYQDPMPKALSQLKRKIYDKQVQLDALDLAIKNASQMIAGIWGGHVINGDTLGGVHQGNMYIADSDNPAEAVKVWRWNLGGLGYSENGINGPFAVAITADGSIVRLSQA